MRVAHIQESRLKKLLAGSVQALSVDFKVDFIDPGKHHSKSPPKEKGADKGKDGMCGKDKNFQSDQPQADK